MKKNGNDRIVFGSPKSNKPEHPTIHEVLSVEQREAIKKSFKDNGICSREDVAKKCKAVKTALKQTGFFKEVNSVPGKNNNDFRVVLKNKGGKVAQGGISFAIS